jgi:hypothetical protein
VNKKGLVLMKNSNRFFTVIIGFVLLNVACNIPGIINTTPTKPMQTPNYTLTALFAPPINIITETPMRPVIDTKLPLNTSTNTNTPIFTSSPSEEPSKTMSPSPTTLPSLTYTIPPSVTPSLSFTPTDSICTRSVETFEAQYFNSVPVIDGVWDEWASSQYPATYITFGSENWKGKEDLSASFRVGWDYKYFYIAAKVGDDMFVQNASGQNIYEGDSLDVLLDTNLCGDYFYDVLSNDDYQLGISPGNPNVDGVKTAFLWFPDFLAGERPQVKIGAVKSDGLYRVEVAIPWSIFEVNPWIGESFGFVFSVNDNDNTKKNIQQSLTSSVASRRLTHPTTWGTLILK